jgi:hypothetical protein
MPFTPIVSGNGFWNHFTGKKKWTITCGNCEHTWSEKVPIQETCSAVCPCCNEQNKWSASKFQAAYEAKI